MIEGVIFDLDGVIVSTDSYHYLAWKKIADQEGLHFDEEINNRLRGVSRLESLNIILEAATKRYSSIEKEELMTKKNNYYLLSLDQLNHSDILPGVQEIIKFLKENNIKVSIGSSSKNAKKILEKIELLNEFDLIADGWDIKNTKPAPDVFLLAAKLMNLDPSKCMVVEDALAGIIAAKKANMFAVAINDATKSDLADLKINSLLDLIDFIKNKNN